MAKFKSKPRADLRAVSGPDPKAVEAFAAGARKHSTELAPWSSMDQKAKPTSGINLRLNEYELTMLRHLAAAEDRSIQRIIKRILVPALEVAAGNSVL